MVFGNGVKNIQAAAYNGARTVYTISSIFLPIKFFILTLSGFYLDLIWIQLRQNPKKNEIKSNIDRSIGRKTTISLLIAQHKKEKDEK